MLAVYIDDSREQVHHAVGPQEIHAIAGYLAPLELWNNEFIPRWRELLSKAPHELKEFKAADCSHCTGVFKKWPREACPKMIIRVVDELVDPRYKHVHGVGTVMKFPAAEDEKTNLRMRDHALEAALHETIAAACKVALGVWGPQPIELFCDRQPGMQYRLDEVWRAIRPGLEKLYGAKLSDFNFRDSVELEPIQAADLLAYEIRADLKHRIETPPREMNISLRRLLCGQPLITFYHDENTYVERADSIAATGEWEGLTLFCISPHMDTQSRWIIDDKRKFTPRHLGMGALKP